ncbi:MAG TPA: riboflavin synthase [Steroidobacteraceae bacterium]|nr:riboflavin synthase [Steroidobacteraceae bacterium]
MFTGIVKSVGRIAAVREGAARRLAIDSGGLATAGWKAGDSVAVSGVCLTLVAVSNGRFEVEISGETISRTTLGRLAAGDAVNLEPSVAAADPLGGHLVTGHVDGVARVRDSREAGGALRATVEAPAALARFIAEKGSIALDGVSLTVNRVAGRDFGVDLVPHTRAVTTLGELAPGRALNLEVDLVARYLDRLLEARGSR